MRIVATRRVRRRSSPARKIAIATGVLLALFVGVGMTYTYFGFQSKPVKEPSKTAAQLPKTIEPVKQSPNAPASAAVQSLTSPLHPGENAMIIIKTNQNGNCKIKAEYNKVPDTDSGLAPKQADEYGSVSWTWTVSATAAEGTWPMLVTCEYNGRTAVVAGNLKVLKPGAPTP